MKTDTVHEVHVPVQYMYRSIVPYSAPVEFPSARLVPVMRYTFYIVNSPLCQVPPGTDSVAWRKYCADTVAYWEKYDKTHK